MKKQKIIISAPYTMAILGWATVEKGLHLKVGYSVIKS